MSGSFIGTGWGWPLRTDLTGRVALVSGDQELVESITLILQTAPGERPMRPEFGCAVHDYVFAPVDAATAGRIGHEVEQSLARWEPRIEVLDLDVRFDDSDTGVLEIHITYSVRGANDPRNLVFPFYVIPAED